MRKLLIILSIFAFFSSNAQVFVPRGSSAITNIDARLGAQYNFYLPRLSDTSLMGGLDTLACLIYVKNIGKIYIRDTILSGGHKWTQVLKSGDSVSVAWGGIIGTLSAQTDLQSALNSKQNQLNGTGFIKALGTTITYDNNTYLQNITGLVASGTGINVTGSGTTGSPYVVNSTVTGISSLNGLTASSQTFAPGTAGTDFNVSSSGSTHNFNLPTVSSANRGLVTPSLYNTWNSKLSNITGLINQGTNVTITGSGTSGSPYVINSSGGGSGWNLTGNSGTIDNTNFIGTTDNVPLNLRVNNVASGRITSNGNQTYFGYQAGNGANSVFTTAIGYQALQNNIGNYSTAIGYQSLQTNTSGNHNVGIGFRALQLNTTGINNVAIGSNALGNNTTGQNNMAIGSASFNNVTSAQFGVALGWDAAGSVTTGDSTTAIGSQSGFNVTTGRLNTFLGTNTGLGIVTGGYNTILGANVTGLSAGLNNNIIIADGKGNQRITVDSLGNMVLNSTTAVKAPSGTTAQRPTGVAGYIRYNADSSKVEYFNGAAWVSFGTGGGGGAGTVTSVGATTGTSGTDFTISGSPITGSGSFTFNLPLASGTNTGKLSNTDWTIFNNKQPAGSYITSLTTDVVAAGPGAAAATIQPLAVTTGKINNNAVTYGKMQAMTANKLLGSGASGTAVAEITLGTGLSFSGTTLNATGVTTTNTVKRTFTLTSHGFTVNEPLYINGSGVPIPADTTNFATMVVDSVINANTFEVTMAGTYNNTAHGLTVGSYYYVTMPAGSITLTSPNKSQPVIFVQDANTLQVLLYRPVDFGGTGGGGGSQTLQQTIDIGSNLTMSDTITTPIAYTLYLKGKTHMDTVLIGSGINNHNGSLQVQHVAAIDTAVINAGIAEFQILSVNGTGAADLLFKVQGASRGAGLFFNGTGTTMYGGFGINEGNVLGSDGVNDGMGFLFDSRIGVTPLRIYANAAGTETLAGGIDRDGSWLIGPTTTNHSNGVLQVNGRSSFTDTSALTARFSYGSNIHGSFTQYSLIDKAFADSAYGGSGGSTNSNVGSAYRWVLPGTNNIKTYAVGYGLINDSSVSNQLRTTFDSATVYTYVRSLIPSSSSDTLKVVNEGTPGIRLLRTGHDSLFAKVFSATNGLTASTLSDSTLKVVLGGELTQNTNITGANSTYSLALGTFSNRLLNLDAYALNGINIVSSGGTGVNVDPGSTGTLTIGNASSYSEIKGSVTFRSVVTGTDANLSIGTNSVAILPDITANRTFSVSALVAGQIYIIMNRNTSVNTWTPNGITIKDSGGNTISSLVNGTVYQLMYDGSNLIKIN